MLFDENSILEAENKRLLWHYHKAFGSGEKSADNASAKVRREGSLIFLLLIPISSMNKLDFTSSCTITMKLTSLYSLAVP